MVELVRGRSQLDYLFKYILIILCSEFNIPLFDYRVNCDFNLQFKIDGPRSQLVPISSKTLTISPA